MCLADSILTYSFPTYHTGKCCYVDFKCIDPTTGSMRRKRYKLDHIKGSKQRKQYAMLLIQSLLQKLMSGWSPWSNEAPIRSRVEAKTVFEVYKKQMLQDRDKKLLRPDTVKSYLSYLNVFAEYIEKENLLHYIDELTVGKAQKFFDFLIHEKNLSSRTHNNYLVWMGNFCGWLQNHEYIIEKPTDSIKPLKESKEKNRTILSENQLQDLKQYCLTNNKHYLLICYLLYYCMIRPKELSMLKIGNIRLEESVIHIPCDVSKNRTSANVTLPQKVISLMQELDLFKYPPHYYIFGQGFKPSKTFRVCKPMSDYWDYYIRKSLGWGKEIKLYSLKDTGITTLLHITDVLTVRDQARHSDISITNVYANRSKTAVQDVKTWDSLEED